jgi:type 1 fimbriae regulatory protein FimB
MKTASTEQNRSRLARTREYLTQPEIKRFLEAAKQATRNPERDYCMMLLTYQHGLRVRELAGLRLSDVDLIERSIKHQPAKEQYFWKAPALYRGSPGHPRLVSDP